MSYTLIYQNDEHEMGGFATVREALDEMSSWDEPQLAITSPNFGKDRIVNAETGKIICYLANAWDIFEKFDIEAGDDFIAGIEVVGTYTDEEVAELKINQGGEHGI